MCEGRLFPVRNREIQKMPLKKPAKDFKPLWKEWDRDAQKHGQRNTVYFVNGDQYTGEWKDNKKCGKNL